MAVEINSIVELVKGMIPELRNSAIGTASDLNMAGSAAFEWHSRYKPRPAVWHGTADGSGVYSLPSDLLSITAVESPWGENPPAYLSRSAWYVHEIGNGSAELMFSTDPGSGTHFAVHYWAEWTPATAPERDKYKLAYLAAAWLSLRRATLSASSTSSVMAADTTNFVDQTRQWLSIFEKFVLLYATVTGLSAKEIMQGAPDPACGLGQVPYANLYQRIFWNDAGATSALKTWRLNE